MNRCFGYAVFVALGIILGVAMTSQQQIKAQPPADDVAQANTDAITELKEIKKLLKDVNEHLRTGVVKTVSVTVMNPGQVQ
jgi:hypothetical protein